MAASGSIETADSRKRRLQCPGQLKQRSEQAGSALSPDREGIPACHTICIPDVCSPRKNCGTPKKRSRGQGLLAGLNKQGKLCAGRGISKEFSEGSVADEPHAFAGELEFLADLLER